MSAFCASNTPLHRRSSTQGQDELQHATPLQKALVKRVELLCDGDDARRGVPRATVCAFSVNTVLFTYLAKVEPKTP